MANNLIQFRADPKIKAEATLICESLGIDLPTYLRLSLARLVLDRGISLDLNMKEYEESTKALRASIDALHKEAVASGASEMTLEEINAEIDAARKELEQERRSNLSDR